MTITMFVLSSAHWIVCIVTTIIDIDVFLSTLGPVPRELPSWTTIIDVFNLVNVSVRRKSCGHIITREHP